MTVNVVLTIDLGPEGAAVLERLCRAVEGRPDAEHDDRLAAVERGLNGLRMDHDGLARRVRTPNP